MVPIPRALAGRTSVSRRFPMWTVCSAVVPHSRSAHSKNSRLGFSWPTTAEMPQTST